MAGGSDSTEGSFTSPGVLIGKGALLSGRASARQEEGPRFNPQGHLPLNKDQAVGDGKDFTLRLWRGPAALRRQD